MKLTRRHLLGLLAATALPLPAQAALQQYNLDAARSTVAFRFSASGVKLRGTMPVAKADIRIDSAALTRSRVDVRVDATKVRSKAAYALPALRSPDILDIANHPRIRFKSSGIRLGRSGRISDGAVVDGTLSLRGITLPVRLNASLFRQRGNAADDLSKLSVQLTGQISRKAFGITAFANLVADVVELDIIARINVA